MDANRREWGVGEADEKEKEKKKEKKKGHRICGIPSRPLRPLR